MKENLRKFLGIEIKNKVLLANPTGLVTGSVATLFNNTQCLLADCKIMSRL